MSSTLALALRYEDAPVVETPEEGGAVETVQSTRDGIEAMNIELDSFEKWFDEFVKTRPLVARIIFAAATMGISLVSEAIIRLGIAADNGFNNGDGVGWIRENLHKPSVTGWLQRRFVHNKGKLAVVMGLFGLSTELAILGGEASAQTASVPTSGGGTATPVTTVTPAQFNPNIDVHADGGTNGDGTGVRATEVSAEADNAEGSTGAETANMTTTEIVISELKTEMPDHAPYVDAQGDFDTRAAAKDLYDTGNYSVEEALDSADQMTHEWYEAYNDKSTEVGARLT